MSRAKIVTLVVIIALGLTVLNYTPAIFYCAYSVGFGIAKSEINGVHIDMDRWWMPISSPGSALESLISRSNTKQLIFVKAKGTFADSRENIIFFSQLAHPITATAMKDVKTISLNWGRVFVISNFNADTNYQSFYYAPENLLITATSVNAVSEIKSIRRR